MVDGSIEIESKHWDSFRLTWKKPRRLDVDWRDSIMLNLVLFLFVVFLRFLTATEGRRAAGLLGCDRGRPRPREVFAALIASAFRPSSSHPGLMRLRHVSDDWLSRAGSKKRGRCCPFTP